MLCGIISDINKLNRYAGCWENRIRDRLNNLLLIVFGEYILKLGLFNPYKKYKIWLMLFSINHRYALIN